MTDGSCSQPGGSSSLEDMRMGIQAVCELDMCNQSNGCDNQSVYQVMLFARISGTVSIMKRVRKLCGS